MTKQKLMTDLRDVYEDARWWSLATRVTVSEPFFSDSGKNKKVYSFVFESFVRLLDKVSPQLVHFWERRNDEQN